MNKQNHRFLLIALCFSILFISLHTVANASTTADPYFSSVNTTLPSSRKIVEFDAQTINSCRTISITSCTLYTQNAAGNWVYKTSLPVPSAVVYNSFVYSTTMDYSAYMPNGGTYRIYTVWNADGHSYGGHSNSMSY